jgi:hypothetical protein
MRPAVGARRTGGVRPIGAACSAVGAYRVADARPRPVAILVSLIPIIGGLIAALAWTTATMTSSRSSRAIGPYGTLAWISIFGLIAAIPLLIQARPPTADDLPALVWVAVAGVASSTGLFLLYAAFKRGKVGLISTITATEGAIAAVIAIVLGEPASLVLIVALAVTVIGLLLTTAGEGTGIRDLAAGRGYVPLAALAALAFGVSLYASGRASADVPFAWIAVAPRIAGAVAIGLPLLLTGRLRLPREIAPYVIAAGIAEIVGTTAYAWGASVQIAIAAVLASQLGLFVAIVSHRMGEPIGRRQWAGVLVAGAGVAAVTIVSLG